MTWYAHSIAYQVYLVYVLSVASSIKILFAASPQLGIPRLHVLHVGGVQAPGPVDALGDLVQIVGGVPQEGNKFPDTSQIQIHDIAVNRHLAKIGRHVHRPQLGHLLRDQLPFPFRHHEMQLNAALPARQLSGPPGRSWPGAFAALPRLPAPGPAAAGPRRNGAPLGRGFPPWTRRRTGRERRRAAPRKGSCRAGAASSFFMSASVASLQKIGLTSTMKRPAPPLGL